MRTAAVHVRLPTGESIVGAELAIDDEVGRYRGGGTFRYHREYLDHPAAYPFDPINLPLDVGEVETEGLPAVPRVIVEALPDQWGRRLLARQHRVDANDVPALILVARPPTVGALSFWPAEDDDEAQPPDLGDLVETAHRIEMGLPVADLSLEARPKTLL